MVGCCLSPVLCCVTSTSGRLRGLTAPEVDAMTNTCAAPLRHCLHIPVWLLTWGPFHVLFKHPTHQEAAASAARGAVLGQGDPTTAQGRQPCKQLAWELSHDGEFWCATQSCLCVLFHDGAYQTPPLPTLRS